MARKQHQEAPEAPPEQHQQHHGGNGNGGGKSPPAMSFKSSVDKTTTIEAAVWPKEMNGDNGSYTVYSVTFRRSYRDDQGNWQNPDAQFFRPHELPVFRWLLDKAYDWIMSQKVKTPNF